MGQSCGNHGHVHDRNRRGSDGGQYTTVSITMTWVQRGKLGVNRESYRRPIWPTLSEKREKEKLHRQSVIQSVTQSAARGMLDVVLGQKVIIWSDSQSSSAVHTYLETGWIVTEGQFNREVQGLGSRARVQQLIFDQDVLDLKDHWQRRRHRRRCSCLFLRNCLVTGKDNLEPARERGGAVKDQANLTLDGRSRPVETSTTIVGE